MAQLVTADYVATTALTNKNTDKALIKDAFIEAAQLEYLRPTLGEDLYDKIVAGGLDTDHQTLLNTYIKPALAFYVKYMIIPDMNANTTSKGTRTFGSDNFTQPASDKSRAELANMTIVMADTLRDKMVRHIEDNLTIFTTYQKGDNIQTSISMKGGIVIPKSSTATTTSNEDS